MLLLADEDDVEVPDSQEGRERITRLEERVESNRRQIEVFGPLPLQMGLVQRGQEELREDLRELSREMDERFDRQEQHRQAWQEKFERSITLQIGECSNRIAQMAEVLKHRDEVDTRGRTEKAIARWGTLGVLGAALLAAGASILNTIIGG